VLDIFAGLIFSLRIVSHNNTDFRFVNQAMISAYIGAFVQLARALWSIGDCIAYQKLTDFRHCVSTSRIQDLAMNVNINVIIV